MEAIGKTDPMGVFYYHYTVQLRETDCAGVMYFSTLFDRFHEAYEAFLQKENCLLPELCKNHHILLPIIHAQADYLSPMRWGESIAVTLQTEKILNHSFSLSFTCTYQKNSLHEKNSLLLAKGSTHHVALDASTGKKDFLPVSFIHILQTIS